MTAASPMSASSIMAASGAAGAITDARPMLGRDFRSLLGQLVKLIEEKRYRLTGSDFEKLTAWLREVREKTG